MKERNEGFRIYVDFKAQTLKPWKWNYYSLIKKSLGLKTEYTFFLKNDFTRTQEPIFPIYNFPHVIISTLAFSSLELIQ